MKTTAALATAVALLATPVLLAAPAEANHARVVVKTCAKTEHGTEVRVRLRFHGNNLKILVSHPRGDYRFENHKVKTVEMNFDGGGVAPPPDPITGGQIGGGAWRDVSDQPVTTVAAGDYNYTLTKFRLTNGKTVKLTCRKHFA